MDKQMHIEIRKHILKKNAYLLYLLLKKNTFIFLNYTYNLIYKYLQHIHLIYIYIYLLSIIINNTIVYLISTFIVNIYIYIYI